MADLWGTLAGIGASLWDSSQEDDRAEQAANTAKELSPNVTQQASLWQNQQNLGNQTWAQKQNQAAMDKAGVGTNTDAFGTTSRTQNADGSWKLNTTLNSADQQLLDALRGKSTTGLGNLDMSGAYNVDGTYAKNFDALNRPNLDRSQQAQRDAAAAMGMGWGSGKGNEVLQSQLNDEQTRFGLSVQNAGHDAWNADQAILKNNLSLSDSMMNNIKTRQTPAPEWGKYSTVNAPTSSVVNKGDINSNLGWAAVGGGNADGTMPGYTDWKAPTVANNPGWSGGALSGVTSSGGNTSWNGSGWSNGEPVARTPNEYGWLSSLNDLNSAYGGNNLSSALLPGKVYLAGATEIANALVNATAGQGPYTTNTYTNGSYGGSGFDTGNWGGGSTNNSGQSSNGSYTSPTGYGNSNTGPGSYSGGYSGRSNDSSSSWGGGSNDSSSSWGGGSYSSDTSSSSW